jgi:hypothetical protein
MRFSPTCLPGNVSAGSGAFSAPGRQKDRPSPVDGGPYSRFDAGVSGLQPSFASLTQNRSAASGASPTVAPTRDFEAQIQTLHSKLNEERAARLASDAAADDLHQQLQARDAIIGELHLQLQQLEQQLFSVLSTMERSAEDALQVERSLRAKSGFSDERRRLLSQQQQKIQLKQDASPSRHPASNGSAFAPSSGSSGPSSSLRSPAVSNQSAQASMIDGQSTTFIKASMKLHLPHGCRNQKFRTQSCNKSSHFLCLCVSVTHNLFSFK